MWIHLHGPGKKFNHYMHLQQSNRFVPLMELSGYMRGHDQIQKKNVCVTFRGWPVCRGVLTEIAPLNMV